VDDEQLGALIREAFNLSSERDRRPNGRGAK
jgi:hypothetical protein